ncbi:MAG: hypothetical protein NC206_08635 [Bacteroides sp.]|nr:hypothetical protein [Roseburia sp.]MCM1347136.1 hypothetical protein [Bacteroides sp.]MCM1421627.1 hypothetical protein [Bacteroides sp.]
MKTTKFLGFYAPVMITTVFMSAIAFTGCSQDDEIDKCEDTYKTHAEMMMTRAGENNQTKPEKPKPQSQERVILSKGVQGAVSQYVNQKVGIVYWEENFVVSVYEKVDSATQIKSYRAEVDTKDAHSPYLDVNVSSCSYRDGHATVSLSMKGYYNVDQINPDYVIFKESVYL